MRTEHKLVLRMHKQPEHHQNDNDLPCLQTGTMRTIL